MKNELTYCQNGQAAGFAGPQGVDREERMKEYDIKYEAGAYWVGRNGRAGYTVYRVTYSGSVPDSTYAPDADGLSIAIARCNYLARRKL